jgi:hypothetical protein
VRYFLDTEFIDRGPQFPLQLISIGLVSEDNRTYYAISDEFDPTTASTWVTANVLSRLEDYPRKCNKLIANEIQQFIGYHDRPEFWGFFADYDWVIFCQLFGTQLDLPRIYPMYCNDIKQLCKSVGDPGLMPYTAHNRHNALADALWNKSAYEFLMGLKKE